MKDQTKLSVSRTFEDLIVWQKAHRFVLKVYQLTASFPQEELYGLTSQLRRAGVSIPANIAEGYKRLGRPDKLRFLNTAQASVEECRYSLILTRDLHYGEVTQLQALLEEVSKLLESYSSAIRRHILLGARAVLLAVMVLLVPIYL